MNAPDPRTTAKQAVSANRYGFDLPPAAPVAEDDPVGDAPVLAVVDAHEWDPVAPDSTPAPITERRSPARAPGLSTSRTPSARSSTATPATRAVEVSQKVNHLGVPYTLIPGEKKERDTSSQVSASLVDGMEQARTFWIADNYTAVKEQLGPSPRSSAFREALLRLGLKHLDDPEFIDLIPVTDGRRR